jgi:hypothetical protein
VATGAVLRRVNVPRMLEREADLLLGELYIVPGKIAILFTGRLAVFCDEGLCIDIGGLPVEVIDILAGPEGILRMAMAIEAPGHREGLVVINDGHVIDLAVAGDAGDAAVHMNGVIIIGVVWGLVELDPGDGLAGGPALADGGELGVILLDLGMAIHADLGVRDIRVIGDLDEGVAVAAIHAELAGVNLMRKRDGLDGLIADAGVLGGEIIPDAGDGGIAEEEEDDQQLERYPIGPAWK